MNITSANICLCTSTQGTGQEHTSQARWKQRWWEAGTGPRTHEHILAMCFHLPYTSDAPQVALLLLWTGAYSLSTSKKTEIIVAYHLRLPLHFWSVLLHRAHAGVWIFNGKPPRPGSLSSIDSWLESNTHTWKVSGGLSWCLLAWRHRDMKGQNWCQAGWLRNVACYK